MQKGIVAKTEISHRRIAADETDTLKTASLEIFERLKDRLLVIHVDEIGIEKWMVGIDEHCWKAAAQQTLNILLLNCPQPSGPGQILVHDRPWRQGWRGR